MNHRSLTSASLVGALCLLAGCSDSASTLPTTVPTTVSTTESTAAAPTTPAPTTTAPPAITTTSEPSSPTTQPTTQPSLVPTSTPDTTADPLTDPAAATLAIIETLELAWRTQVDVLQDPFNDAKIDALGDVYSQRLVDGWLNVVDGYRSNNHRTIDNSDQPATYEVDPTSITVNLSAGTATAQACYFNSFIKIAVGGNSDGSDEIIDDSAAYSVELLELVADGASWKVNSARRPDATEAIPCP